MTTPGQNLFVIWDQGTGDTRTALQALASRSPAGISISFADRERQGGDLLTKILVPGIRAADRVLVAFPPDNALVTVAFETGIAIGLGKPIAVLELRASSYLLSYACDLLFGSEILENGITVDLTELREKLLDPALWHTIQIDTEAPVNSGPLIVCPQEGIGMELRERLKELRPGWNSPPRGSSRRSDPARQESYPPALGLGARRAPPALGERLVSAYRRLLLRHLPGSRR